MNMDGSYFRNEGIIARQHSCSNYKSLRSYSTCTEEKIKATTLVDQERDLAKEAEKRAAKAKAKAEADAKAKAAAAPAPAPAAQPAAATPVATPAAPPAATPAAPAQVAPTPGV